MSLCECNGHGYDVSRRAFLGGLSAAAVTTLGASSLQVAHGNTGTHTLIVINLRGGFDGLNAIAPVGDPNYQAAREKVGVRASQALPLEGVFGLHPAMAPLHKLWNDGDLAVVQAVGQIEQDRSHFSAMAKLERAANGTGERSGWLDRVVAHLDHSRPFSAVQLGDTSMQPGFVGPTPEVVTQRLKGMYFDFGGGPGQTENWASNLREIYDAAPGINDPALRDALAVTSRGACDSVIEAGRVRANFPIEGDDNYDVSQYGTQASKGYTPYTYGEDLATALQDLARLLKAGSGVRVAAIEFGGWDMHALMGTVDSGKATKKLAFLSQNIRAFRDDIGDLWNNVTVVTMSEFGRRLAENASLGLDHGYGNAMLVMGGQVAGRRIHGQWPGIGPADLVKGDLRVTTDYRQVLSEVLVKRLEIGSAATVFPGLAYRPIGALS